MSFPVHVTVATVIERDGEFLFVEEMDNGQRVINQPAGHLEPGESLVAAAVRETQVETACEVRIEGVLGMGLYRAPANGITYYRTAFYGSLLSEHADQSLDEGIVGTHWLSREMLLAGDYRLRSPMVLSTLDQYLRGERYPLSLFFHGADLP